MDSFTLAFPRKPPRRS